MNRQSISKAQKKNSILLPPTDLLQHKTINRTDFEATKVDIPRISGQHIDKYSLPGTESEFNHDLSKIPVRLNSRNRIQAKLKIGQPDDKYEQEADRVAEQVMRMPDPRLSSSVGDSSLANSTILGSGTIQRACASCSAKYKTAEDENCPVQPANFCPKCRTQEQGLIQTKQITPLIQTKTTANVTPEVTTAISSGIQSLQSGGRPLSGSERSFFEPRFGADFSSVRVHDDTRAASVAQSVNARAFTLGQNVVFGAGEYSSDSLAGRKLLAHELAHVAQQSPVHAMDLRSGTAPVSQAARSRLQRAVGSVSCQNPSGRVRDIVGDDPIGIVRAADRRANELLDNAIGELAFVQPQIRGGEPAAWPTIPDELAMALQNRFGINPEDREVWTSRRHTTRRGSPTITLLLVRLRRTRGVLAGNIRYRCLERPPCPPMSRPGEVVLGPLAFSGAGEMGIDLCEGFWRPTKTVHDRALIIAHEAFHIYFGGIDRGRNMWNAHCIEHFIADLNGVTKPEGCCAPGASCGY